MKCYITQTINKGGLIQCMRNSSIVDFKISTDVLSKCNCEIGIEYIFFYINNG